MVKNTTLYGKECNLGRCHIIRTGMSHQGCCQGVALKVSMSLNMRSDIKFCGLRFYDSLNILGLP